MRNMGRFDAEMGKIRIKLMATFKLSCCHIKVNNYRITASPILDLIGYPFHPRIQEHILEVPSLNSY